MEPSELFVKICCIASLGEARVAIEAGASALGLVSEMPSGPGVIDEQTIAAVAAEVRGEVETFLLTSLGSSEDIVSQHRRLGTSALQLVDHLTTDTLRRLRDALPDVGLVQVIHVAGPESVEYALEVEPCVDRILLDSGRPSAQVKVLGGTGETHDWAVSLEIREAVSVPVILAGGLNVGNVAEAIEAVAPFGVDTCSGLRPAGRLDPDLAKAFVRKARQAPRD